MLLLAQPSLWCGSKLLDDAFLSYTTKSILVESETLKLAVAVMIEEGEFDLHVNGMPFSLTPLHSSESNIGKPQSPLLVDQRL